MHRGPGESRLPSPPDLPPEGVRLGERQVGTAGCPAPPDLPPDGVQLGERQVGRQVPALPDLPPEGVQLGERQVGRQVPVPNDPRQPSGLRVFIREWTAAWRLRELRGQGSVPPARGLSSGAWDKPICLGSKYDRRYLCFFSLYN